jgi:hypothetical protein
MGYFGVKRGDNPVNKVFVKKILEKIFQKILVFIVKYILWENL